MPSSPASRSAKPNWSTPRAPASWLRSCRRACAPFRPQISPENGAGGFILPNDRVDVILTRRDRERRKDAGAAKCTPARRFSATCACWRSTRTIEEKNGQKVVVGKTATLELSRARPKRWRCRSSSARCRSRCAASPTPSKPMSPTPTETDARRGIVNVIRFGVSTQTTPK